MGTSTIGTGVVLAIFAPRYCAYATAVARYDGSMTTPGCQETVLWHSFLDAIDISQNQVHHTNLGKGSIQVNKVQTFAGTIIARTIPSAVGYPRKSNGRQPQTNTASERPRKKPYMQLLF